MVFGMTWYQVFMYFLLYSFLGWVAEVTFHAAALGLVINRGFLNGPVCPVYGFGMLAVFSMVHLASGATGGEVPLWLLFLGGMLLASCVEFLAGWFLDKVFHAKWWDYSDKPFNLHGYICLQFSLLWGIGAVLVVRVLQPALQTMTVERIPESYGWPLMGLLYALYFSDLVVTLLMLRGFNQRLRELDELKARMRIPSDAITKVVASNAIRTSAAIGEGRVQASLAKAELQSAAAEKYEEALIAMSEGKAAAVNMASDLKTTVTETASGLKNTAVGSASNLKNTAVGTASSLKNAAVGTASGLKNATAGTMQSLAQEILRKKEDLWHLVSDGRYFGVGRMLRAFPQLEHRDYRDLVNEMKHRLQRREEKEDGEA